MARFPAVPTDLTFPQLEERILELWEQGDTFRRSVEKNPRSRSYIFYDGPPFATGLPHYGHIVPGTLKDIVPRYWTMRGYRVERRFGWDTHGLPIEMLMEQELGLNGPGDVRAYGVDRFNEACRDNVLKYTEEWRRIMTRAGRWVDFDDDYKTMDPTFMESVWWVFKQLWDQGLVYREFRVMPYSWRLSTSLSNFEANLDYRDVQDPAITVTMPLEDGDEVLLVWTTTPWTLPSNLGVAVGEEIPYVRARKAGDDTVYVVAQELVNAVLGDDATVVGAPFPGRELVGRPYRPLFDYFAERRDSEGAFRVILAPHVTTEDGTGLVHMAPDFGEEDYEACKARGISVLLSVDDEGNFVDAVTDYAGRNVKAADPDIIRALKERGRLFRHDTIQHAYPFCWRSGTPLIYRAVPAWFVRVTDLRERMSKHNEDIHWVPEAVGSKRFGNWLSDARDWNVSRNRFWGTPLPIWTCERCEQHVCLGSIAELEQATGAEVSDLHPHKIDHLRVACPSCGGDAKRVSDVFDCWFESGSMPYGQGHYPFEDKEHFEENFPANFIAEGLDQTRGWFYTLLVLSTALFDRPPFQNVVVNGMVLAEDGSKMSKSKRNYPPPEDIFHRYGADALRAYLIDSPVVRAEPLRFSETGVREVARTVLIPMMNAWSFFVQYANIDGWTPDGGLPGTATPPLAERPEIDRWLLSHQQSLVRTVHEQMELYQLYNVVPAVVAFIDDLTNWYIRLSRRRFWRGVAEAGAEDKAAAYATLYEALVAFTKILAPFLPFLSEAMYQGLVIGPGCAAEGEDSVHLASYPEVQADRIDEALEAQVAVTRDVVRLGRRLRERHKLKTRQPLARLTVVHHDSDVRAALSNHHDLLADELNVKEVHVSERGDELAELTCKPDYKRLGRRYGKRMKAAASRIEAFTSEDWALLEHGGTLEVEGEEVGKDDIIVRREPKGDVVVETEGGLIVAFDTELSDALVREGMAREVVSFLQKQRKEQGFEVTDRIRVRLSTDDAELRRALEDQRDWVAGEVLASELRLDEAGPVATRISSVRGEHALSVGVERA